MKGVELHERDLNTRGFILVDQANGVWRRPCVWCRGYFSTVNPDVIEVCGSCTARLPAQHRRNFDAEVARKVREPRRVIEPDQDEMVKLFRPDERKELERKGLMFHDRRRWT